MDVNSILCFDIWLSIAEINPESFAAIRSINRQIRDYTNDNITKYQRKFLNEVEVIKNGINKHYWTLPNGNKHGLYERSIVGFDGNSWIRCNYHYGKLHGMYQEGINNMIFEEYNYIDGKKMGQ